MRLIGQGLRVPISAGLVIGLMVCPQGVGAEEPSTNSDQEVRRGRYLEMALQQTLRLERAIGPLGPARDAAGALSAMALASAGRPTGGDAARWIVSALDACQGRWHKGDCPRAQLPLQRVLLQYPAVVPGALRRRLRQEVKAVADAPPATHVAAPWSFEQTENQRTVDMARSLVGHVVAGTGASPEARRWEAVAEAFLVEHDRSGWYEGDSAGYLAISINGLLHLADHAASARIRELATRATHLLLAGWAQQQVGGYPAGARSRTYIHWALGTINTPWRGWAWLASGRGDPEGISFGDWPELATTIRYEIPGSVGDLLEARRTLPPHEIRIRRRFDPEKRRKLDAALYSYGTPDYILSASQSISGLQLGVSGGQEIMATLLAEGPDFAPIYLWSRVDAGRSKRWTSWAQNDLAVARRNLLVARLGALSLGGHVYLGKVWEEPTVRGTVAVTRYGETYVALVSEGGWRVAEASREHPKAYGDRRLAGAKVLVPKGGGAVSVGMEVGRGGEEGSFEKWRKRVLGKARLEVVEGEIRFRASGGSMLTFLPGVRASFDGERIEAASYPVLEGPCLRSMDGGGWRFNLGKVDHEIPPLP